MYTSLVNRSFDKYEVYIGRGTKWGNPFEIGKDGNREEVIALYKQYAKNNPAIYNSLEELRGKILGCSCKPQPCHGDVLMEMLKYKKLIIGLDQSYTRTGISIAIDGKLRKVTSIPFKGCRNKSDKRIMLRSILQRVIDSNQQKATEVIIICERIRTFSQGNAGAPDVESKGGKPRGGGFISTNYIKATGALIATIVDIAYANGIKVYSTDTRAWKAQVVGNMKAIKGDKKLATMRFVKKLGFDVSRINQAGNKVYDDDASDSACIALYGFIDVKKQKLKLEE